MSIVHLIISQTNALAHYLPLQCVSELDSQTCWCKKVSHFVQFYCSVFKRLTRFVLAEFVHCDDACSWFKVHQAPNKAKGPKSKHTQIWQRVHKSVQVQIWELGPNFGLQSPPTALYGKFLLDLAPWEPDVKNWVCHKGPKAAWNFEMS